MQSRTEEVPASPPRDAVAADPWSLLAQARTAEQLCQAWLPVLCGMLTRPQSGLLLLQDADGSYAPAAVWPGHTDLSYLGDIAQEALVQRKGVVRSDPEAAPTRFAYPLDGGDSLFGVVVVELAGSTDATLNQAMRLLHWGVGWLIDLHNRRALVDQETRLERSSFLFDLTLAALAESDFQKASLAVVNRLAQQFGCHQVQLGLEKGKTVRVVAVSHFGHLRRKGQPGQPGRAGHERGLRPARDRHAARAGEGATLITAAMRAYANESRQHRAVRRAAGGRQPGRGGLAAGARHAVHPRRL
jgi:hypothetical protein